MCGIAGYLHSDNNSRSDQVIIKHMVAMLNHRGPDARGYYLDDHVALGNSRLSIIDLAGGDQPICDQTERYWIVYNGEIYNYRELRSELIQQGCCFQTNSDTEVLLQGWITWQEDVLPRLNGAFAFAIYDRQTRQLMLARDRYGLRPLYYYQLGSTFVFASELKSLLLHPAVSFTFDPERVARIFTLWTPLVNETAFAHLHQLTPGCRLTVAEGQIHIQPYYLLDLAQTLRSEKTEQLIQETRHQLAESVRLRSRSDVEIGVYLSGGLDSAIVTRLAQAQNQHNLRSFSLAFEDSAFDEKPQQDLLSAHFGTRHTHLLVRNADIATAFPKAVWHAEVPLFRTALVPMLLLSQMVQAQGIKVVMTGEGADESFLGYNIFKETALRATWHTLSETRRQEIISALYPYLSHFGGQNYAPLLSMYRRSLEEQEPGLFSHQIRYTNAQFAVRMLNTGGANHFPDLSAALYSSGNGAAVDFAHFSPLQQAQWLEFKTLLAGYLLSSQGDRMSLAHGVENRCPFLDHHVVNFASTLPTTLKLKDYTDEKHILKRSFCADLPKSIVERPKQPYRAPDAVVFRDQQPDYLELLLSEQELAKSGLINTKLAGRFVQKVMQSAGNELSPRENQAFIQLLSLQLLQQFFVDKKPPVACIDATVFAKAIDLRGQLA